LGALAPRGARDIQAQTQQATTVQVGHTKGVLLPMRYSAPYTSEAGQDLQGVTPSKFFCGVAHQAEGGTATLIATIGTDATADLECYGIKAIGTVQPHDASSLILIYDVGKLPRVSPYAVVLRWDDAEHSYHLDNDDTNRIAEHLTTSTTIANVRRFLNERH